ncbi:MAG: DUF1648 domain-containing protein [Erysipelotrichaceae bacterium]
MRKLKYISTLVCIILILIYGIHLALIYKTLPNMVPDHFDFAGNVNSYGNKISLVMEPLISIMIIVVMDVVSNFPDLWNYPVKVTEDNKDFLFKVTLIMVSVLKVIVTILLLYIGLCSIYSFLPVILTYVFVILLLVVCFGSIFIMWRGQ